MNSTSKKNKLCPCGSLISYKDCCQLFISGQQLPASPEALMRSRYTAYSRANIKYIEKTMRGQALQGFDVSEAKSWALRSKWLGLTVVNSYLETQDKGFVEFIATYSHQNKHNSLHELSEFHRINGQWFYVDGKLF